MNKYLLLTYPPFLTPIIGCCVFHWCTCLFTVKNANLLFKGGLSCQSLVPSLLSLPPEHYLCRSSSLLPPFQWLKFCLPCYLLFCVKYHYRFYRLVFEKNGRVSGKNRKATVTIRWQPFSQGFLTITRMGLY